LDDWPVASGWPARAQSLLANTANAQEVGWVALNICMVEADRARKEERFRAALAAAVAAIGRSLDATGALLRDRKPFVVSGARGRYPDEAVSSAAPNAESNRSHQITTLAYAAGSASAGIS
jgi:hypothetical protein